ncbi:MAG: hypothetical protein C0177_00150 [Fervidicoccus fontis]|nr:MAG: hypothetical protein C0177_00150 [Fervidicoccus fontis]
MKVELGFSGSFPRDEKVAEFHSLRKSKEINERDFMDKILSKEISLLFGLEKLGFTYSTDGMLWADDIINPIVSMSNVEINGLVRFFDNNFFVRSPVVREKLSLKEWDLIKWFSEISNRTAGKSMLRIKAPLPGPVTLASFSQNKFYSSISELTIDWGENFLVPLIDALEKLGFSFFELHEPSFMDRKLGNEVKEVGSKEISGILERFNKSEFFILTYFNGTTKDLSHLMRVSKDNSVIGLDLHLPFAWKMIAELSKKGLETIYLGALDSRNPIPERNRLIKGWLDKAERLGFERIIIGNNAPMDFIPPKWALSKLRKLSKSVRIWGE